MVLCGVVFYRFHNIMIVICQREWLLGIKGETKYIIYGALPNSILMDEIHN